MDKKNIIITLAITSLLLGLTVTVSAEEDPEQTTEINVTIASEVALDVQPETLNFQDVNIGEQHNISDEGFDGITVENIGSEYVDSIWVEASMPSERPFGEGDASLYDSGNFIQIKPDYEDRTDWANEDNYFFVNRKEYEEASNLDYINEPEPGTDTLDNGADIAESYVGRFRNADEEIFWVISSSDSQNGQCDGSEESEIRVGQTPHTPEGLGTTDFSDSGEDYQTYEIESVVDGGPYGIAESEVNLPFENKVLNYAILSQCDIADEEAHTIRTKYNIGPTDNYEDLSQDYGVISHVMETSTSDRMLVPGETFVLRTSISVPTGVVQGEITTGTLTLLATADTDQTN